MLPWSDRFWPTAVGREAPEGGVPCKQFPVAFTEAKTLRQLCHWLGTELAELYVELRESRGKSATLVLMWPGVSRELAKAEAELSQVKASQEEAAHEGQELRTVAPEGLEDDQPRPVTFGLT